jgi:hypothetical protein
MIINFTILVEAFLLYITMHSVFPLHSTCAIVEKKVFENWSILGSFCPAPRPQGDRDHEIQNYCSSSPIDAISKI